MVKQSDFVSCVIQAYDSLAPVFLGVSHGRNSYKHLILCMRGLQKVSGSLPVISESLKRQNRVQLTEGRFDNLPKLFSSAPSEDGLSNATEKLICILHAQV